MKESQIQKLILDYLRLKGFLVFKHRNVGIWIQSKQRYMQLPEGEKGISDIIGLTPSGRFLAVEVKAPKQKPSVYQKDFIERVKAKGGIAFYADSLEMAENELAILGV